MIYALHLNSYVNGTVLTAEYLRRCSHDNEEIYF